jgi:exonuclease III
MFEEFKTGTWNILSLYQPGALKMLLEQLDRYKLDITVIQEMRWIGEVVIEKKDHIVFYSCQKRDHIFGTGFIINKRIKHLIVDIKAKSSRMCRLRIRGQFLITISYVYMPQLKKRMLKKKIPFMMTWIRPMRSILGGISIIGDLNAKIGYQQANNWKI